MNQQSSALVSPFFHIICAPEFADADLDTLAIPMTDPLTLRINTIDPSHGNHLIARAKGDGDGSRFARSLALLMRECILHHHSFTLIITDPIQLPCWIWVGHMAPTDITFTPGGAHLIDQLCSQWSMMFPITSCSWCRDGHKVPLHGKPQCVCGCTHQHCTRITLRFENHNTVARYYCQRDIMDSVMTPMLCEHDIAATKIQRYWHEARLNPYCQLGIDKINRDYDQCLASNRMAF